MRHNFEEDDKFTDDMSFGEYIRKKRRLLGYNQTDFADILGVTQGTLCRWELGDTSPQIEYARDIVGHFGGKILIVNEVRNEQTYN